MGVDESESRASLRFSVGRMTTAEEIDFAIETVRQVVGKIEKDASQNAWDNTFYHFFQFKKSTFAGSWWQFARL